MPRRVYSTFITSSPRSFPFSLCTAEKGVLSLYCDVGLADAPVPPPTCSMSHSDTVAIGVDWWVLRFLAPSRDFLPGVVGGDVTRVGAWSGAVDVHRAVEALRLKGGGLETLAGGAVDGVCWRFAAFVGARGFRPLSCGLPVGLRELILSVC